MRFAQYDLNDIPKTVLRLVGGQPNFLEITTPSTAGAELEITHGLGRVPNGYVIFKRPYTGTATDLGAGDTAWTAERMYLTFEETGFDMTIAIF